MWLRRSMVTTLSKHLECSSGTSTILRRPWWTFPTLLLSLMSGLWRTRSSLNRPFSFMGRAFIESDRWYGVSSSNFVLILCVYRSTFFSTMFRLIGAASGQNHCGLGALLLFLEEDESTQQFDGPTSAPHGGASYRR